MIARAPISWLAECRKYNHLIVYISNSSFKFKFSNSEQTFAFNLPVFAAKRIFKTYQHFCFLCFHSRWHFFWFHKHREITKNLFTLAESNLSETIVHLLELWRNFICGNETGSPGRAVSLHLAHSGSQSEHRIRRILPARGACHIIKWNTTYLTNKGYWSGSASTLICFKRCFNFVCQRYVPNVNILKYLYQPLSVFK